VGRSSPPPYPTRRSEWTPRVQGKERLRAGGAAYQLRLRPHPPGQASRYRAKGERLDATSVACQCSESFPASASGGPGTMRLPVNPSTEPPGTRRGPPVRERRPLPQLHRLRRLAGSDGGTGGGGAPVDHGLLPGKHREEAGAGEVAVEPEDGAGRRRRRGGRDAEPPLSRPLDAPGGVMTPWTGRRRSDGGRRGWRRRARGQGSGVSAINLPATSRGRVRPRATNA